MLLSISITNFILIDSLELDLKSGLTVLTGETGAGKSIILDAIQCALGDRASNKYLKDKTKAATISLVFDISELHDLKKLIIEQGLDASEELILRRSISTDGKSKAYINDIPCTIGQLQNLKDYLLEICGQHDSRGLLENSQHINLLDQYAKIDLVNVSKSFLDWKKLDQELKDLRLKLERSEIEKSFLKSVIFELKELNIKEGEEQSLAEQRKLLQEGGKIKESVTSSHNIISALILPNVYKLQKELNRFEDFFKEPIKMINNACIEIQEAESSITDLSSKFSSEYDSLQSLEDRLFKIRSLARKFNTLSEDFPKMLTEKEAELSLIENSKDAIESLEKSLNIAKETYLKYASEVSKLRAKEIKNLEQKILDQFADLKLDKAEFKVEQIVVESTNDYTVKGIDKIKFLIKTNPGQPFDQLSKIASGGELSRFLLAIKVSCADTTSVPLMIFDEIDTGVSGAVSSSIGRKLLQVAKNSQVLVVTHQPQVTAFANNHILVSKSVKNNQTSVQVRELNKDEREEEVARLLSGEKISEESFAAAKKLMQAAA